MSVQLEICVESPAGVAAAIAGGADRIELCAALDVGGLTPSTGLLAACREAAGDSGIPIFAMVRPRPGDFAYDAAEAALARREAMALIDAGADGLVFGACAGGAIDENTAISWISAVRDHAGQPLPCTFHRAIDLADDLPAAAERVAAMGYDRILSSGGAIRAIDGVDTLAAMIARVGDRITIMAGSGVSAATVPALTAAGVRAFHGSASRPSGRLDDRVRDLGFAASPRRVTDTELVAELREALSMTIL
ncbi:copper homeostasis protein CutC [Sphingomonas floccifaciens]|uniref:PF03932 family protein CutC n=1 Tax=Sphingomonas floccifaciens TaxID=1844115 RepID=A0ABW4NIH2_9SPHN